MAKLFGWTALAALACSCGIGTAAAAPAAAPAPSEQQKAVYILNRLAFGPAPGDVDRVMRMGVAAYIDEQLHPERLPDPPALQQRLDALRTQQLDAVAGRRSGRPPARTRRHWPKSTASRIWWRTKPARRACCAPSTARRSCAK
jgi:hypothetical protein